MSTRSIVIGGVTYIRSRDAARVVNLAFDYVSRLARAELIDGRRVENIWFINVASLQQFLSEQERHKQAWRARLAQMRREEQRLAGHPSAAH